MHWDIIISGSGIIGLSIALELRERGAEVLVLERGQPGHEASSAAAGMIAPADPETPLPLLQMARASAAMFPEYVRKLESAAGMKVDFRRLGTIALLEHNEAPQEYRALSSAEMQGLEPSLQAFMLPAFFVQEDSVDPRLLMQAAMMAVQKSKIAIRTNAAVKELRSAGHTVEIFTATEHFSARKVINCQGAWSGAPVRPRKGQMLYLQPEGHNLLQYVVRAPEVYIVPRSSGKILVGATVEDVGFDKTVDPESIHRLVKAGTKYLPELASSKIVDSWAGLRPGTPDDLPILGLTETPGVFVASGHFRNGILLAPATAQIMADLVMERPLGLEIAAFSPSRFAVAEAK